MLGKKMQTILNKNLMKQAIYKTTELKKLNKIALEKIVENMKLFVFTKDSLVYSKLDT